MMIDAHIHLDQYEISDRTSILKEMEQFGVTQLLTVSTNLNSCKSNLLLSKQDERIKPAFGYHPEQPLPKAEEVTELIRWMKEHIESMVAVGEVGLPYYLKAERQGNLDYHPYIQLLEQMIALSMDLDKPIVLHAVYEDAEIVCDLLEKYGVKKAHFHWFKGNEQIVSRMITNGYFISITPDVLYEEEIQQLVQRYPLEHMMIETDGPWPFEGPFLAQITHPRMMMKSVQKIAELKQKTINEVADTLYANTKKFYRLG